MACNGIAIRGDDDAHIKVKLMIAAETAGPCRSARTRSSLGCSGIGISAISSRNKVPPWACSKQPGRVPTAPVNAPRSWPKTSLSIRVSGIAAALTATKGRSERALSLMDGPSHEFLAGAAFARDDHRNIPARNHLDQVEDFAHGFARADEVSEQAFGLDVGGETSGFSTKLDFPLGIIQQGFELCEVGDGLGQEIPGALLDGLDSHVDAAARCNQQDGPLRVACFQIAKQFESGDFRHDDIADHDVGIMTVHQLLGFSRVCRLQNVESPALQENIERLEHRRIVVNDKNLSFSRCHCW